MFRVTLACTGVPADCGSTAAHDIQQEFAEYRNHYKNVVCAFHGGELVITAENEIDRDGLNLLDEFSDCLAANTEPFDGDVRIVGIEEF